MSYSKEIIGVANIIPKRVREEIEVVEYISGGTSNVLERLFFLFVLPLAIGGVIAFYLSFYQMIDGLVDPGKKIVFFLIQLSGVVYFYLLLSENLDKCFGFKEKEIKGKDIERFLRRAPPKDFYITGILNYLIGALWMVMRTCGFLLFLEHT